MILSEKKAEKVCAISDGSDEKDGRDMSELRCRTVFIVCKSLREFRQFMEIRLAWYRRLAARSDL